MNILQDYLDDLERQLRRLPKAERAAVLAEVKTHLEEAAAGHQAGTDLSEDEAMLRATHRFGTPKEVAAGYSPQTGEVRVGSVVLDVARATGRGLGKTATAAGKGAVVVGRGAGHVLKWSVIAALGVILVAGVVAVAVLVVFDDEIKEAVPRPLDSYQRTCSAVNPCAAPDTGAMAFDIGPDVKEFRVLWEGDCEAGSARVTATSPSGETITVAGELCDNSGHRVFTEPGRWRFDVIFTGYVGWVDLDAYAFERA